MADRDIQVLLKLRDEISAATKHAESNVKGSMAGMTTASDAVALSFAKTNATINATAASVEKMSSSVKSQNLVSFYHSESAARQKTLQDLAAARAAIEPTIQKMREHETQMLKVRDAQEQVGKGMGKMALMAGTAFAGMFAVSKIEAMAQGSLDLGKSIEDTSRKMVLSTDSFQKISYMAMRSGTDINGMQRAFSTLAKEAMKSDNIIGISTREAGGGVKETGKLFEELLYRIAAIKNPTVALATSMKVFGMAGREVYAMASQGKDRLHELAEETVKYNTIIDKDTLGKLAAAKESQERLNEVWKVTTARLMGMVSPAIISGLEKINTLFGDIARTEGNRPERLREAKVFEEYLGLKKKNNEFTNDEIRQLKLKQDIDMINTSIKGKSLTDEIDGSMTVEKFIIRRIKLERELYALRHPAAPPISTDDAALFGSKSKRKPYEVAVQGYWADQSPEEWARQQMAMSNAGIMQLPGENTAGERKAKDEELQREQDRYGIIINDTETKIDNVYNQKYAFRLNKLKQEQKKELEAYRMMGRDVTNLIKFQTYERERLAKEEHDRKIMFEIDYAQRSLGLLATMADGFRANAQLKKRIAEGEAVVGGAKAVMGILANTEEYLAVFGPVGGPIAWGTEIGLTIGATAAQIAKIESAKMWRGGEVTGGEPGKDSVWKLLMPGEHVWNPRHPDPVVASNIMRSISSTTNTSQNVTHYHQNSFQIVVQGNDRNVGATVVKAIRKAQAGGKIPSNFVARV